ncbi:MAG TPA: TetR/AcrR family transcriptional regulator [Aggregatilineales bacterium]|nr:TetR/AcrR family transcriptional regulator [Anaerolineae bacterium]HUN09571.1 TetR/AcrR family transcriptional regulator [Aggregatilineales bacterium]
MTDNSKSPNPVATRERILDAALDVFSSKGYHDSSVDDVVRESNTSKGAVYFHFANKQQLFVALVDKFANLLERRVTEAIENQPNSVARIRAALEACLETFSKYRPLAKILLVQAVGLGTIFEQKRMEVLERFARLIQTNLEQAIASGELPPVDAEITAQAWLGSIYQLVIRWVYLGEPKPDRLTATLVPLLLRSVGIDDK